ncbi:hypothetical protein [Chitinimonas naiadis]
MRLKSAFKFIAGTNLVAAILTLVAALLLKRTSPLQLADTGTIVAIVIVALGALMARGARIGDGPVVDDMTSATSTTPGHVRWADSDNVLAGMNQGALMIVAGLVWLGLVALAYRVFT